MKSMVKESRIMSEEDSKAFIQNMRWFAGHGTIKSIKIGNGQCRVTATKAAFSNWAFPNSL